MLNKVSRMIDWLLPQSQVFLALFCLIPRCHLPSPHHPPSPLLPHTHTYTLTECSRKHTSFMKPSLVPWQRSSTWLADPNLTANETLGARRYFKNQLRKRMRLDYMLCPIRWESDKITRFRVSLVFESNTSPTHLIKRPLLLAPICL